MMNETHQTNPHAMRPIRRVYVNFDKDISHRMFGYRIKFEEEKQLSYMKNGTPSIRAS